MSRLRSAGLALAVVLALCACSPSSADPVEPDEPAEPTDLTQYLSQRVSWAPCPDSDEFLDAIPAQAECGTVEVPVNYFNDASGRGDLQLALIRIPATGESHGSLLMNPGGPGASGFDSVASSAEALQDHLPGYDIVGFDPRGVGRSAGFDCQQGTQTRRDLIEEDFTPERREEFESYYKATESYDKACREHNPAWGFLGTASVARDVYIMSRAVGDPEINFYGISYGSVIGYELLRTYPDDIGRMILESPVDPAVEDSVAEQISAFNDRLEELLKACAADAFCGQGRSAQEVRDAFLKIGKGIEHSDIATLTDDGHPSEALVYYGLLLPFYLEWSDEWQGVYLQALDSLLNDRDARYFEYWGYLYESYDLQAQRFTQTDDIQGVVLCLDESTSPEEIDVDEERSEDLAELQQIKEQAPLFYAVGFSDAYTDDDRLYQPCSYARAAFADPTIPDPLPEAPAVTNPGDVPVLLMGVTGDTATPYRWAQTIAGNLGVPLVSQDTTGHGVYSKSDNPCTLAVVTAYLAVGQLPEVDTTC